MNTLQLLQQKIGVDPDGSFGPGTLKAAMVYYKMNKERAAHFFGQTGVESANFHTFSENLNYSEKVLLSTFSKYFNATTAAQYVHQPNKIGARVYANRMGNGDEKSQDGYTFRGRGAVQLTGKENYKAFATFISKPEILTNPDLVSTDYAFESALFFFDKNKLWDICDKGVNVTTILMLTKRINGGTTALDERTSLTNTYYKWLNN